MADEITPETFLDHVNKTFRVDGGAEPLDFELTGVEVHKDPQIEGLRQPFILIFRGPKGRVLPEGLYKVQNEDAGSMDLYFIPIVTVGDHQDYQVVFG